MSGGMPSNPHTDKVLAVRRALLCLWGGIYLSSSTLLAELNRIDKDIAVQEKKKAGYDKKASDLDKKIIDTTHKGFTGTAIQ